MAYKDHWLNNFGVVLPHEWVFGTYLLLTGLRLCAQGGAALGWSCVFFGCLLGCIGIVAWAERDPTPRRWRVRLLFYSLVMGICFYAMGVSVPLLGNPAVDRLLLQWDRALIGDTPAVALEPWLRPWLEDLAMAGYLFFFFYLVVGPGYYCARDLRLFRKSIVGLFTMYGMAFMGYTLLPAGGPHTSMSFVTPLHGPLLLDWSVTVVNAASNHIDAFPSVHIAGSLYLLLFDWRHYRRRFWLLLLPCMLLWFAAVYLRFHYFVDLLAGTVIALVGWWIAEHYETSTDDQPIFAAEVNAGRSSASRAQS